MTLLTSETCALSLKSNSHLSHTAAVGEKNDNKPCMNEETNNKLTNESNSGGFSVLLLKNPIFMLFAISNFLMCIGFYPPFVYIVDQAIFLRIDPYKADCIYMNKFSVII